MKRACLKSDGFTLIELLVVISIIAILASLTIATIGYATNKAARDRTKSEINALSVALESYKIDNGDYPRSTNTDALNARSAPQLAIQNSVVPTPSGPASLTLYTALSGDGADGSAPNRSLSAAEKTASNNRIYFQFKPNMLYPRAPAGSTSPVTALVDPFLNVYGYSTIGSKANRNATTEGYNPTFDLWSTVNGSPIAGWITNW